MIHPFHRLELEYLEGGAEYTNFSSPITMSYIPTLSHKVFDHSKKPRPLVTETLFFSGLNIIVQLGVDFSPVQSALKFSHVRGSASENN